MMPAAAWFHPVPRRRNAGAGIVIAPAVIGPVPVRALSGRQLTSSVFPAGTTAG